MFEILHVGHKLTNNMYNIINTVESDHFIVNVHMLLSTLLLFFHVAIFFFWTQGQLNF